MQGGLLALYAPNAIIDHRGARAPRGGRLGSRGQHCAMSTIELIGRMGPPAVPPLRGRLVLSSLRTYKI